MYCHIIESMTVHRARAYCPNCNHKHEVWYTHGVVKPTNDILCDNCTYEFEADSFTFELLDFYSNVTHTIKNIATTV
jgi:transcription elongation factor Elf1